jgi:hypothetical protein
MLQVLSKFTNLDRKSGVRGTKKIGDPNFLYTRPVGGFQ